MKHIPLFVTRPTWNDELALLVPKIEFQPKHHLKKGSAVVAVKRPSGQVVAYYEGNLYNACNVNTFDEKAMLAYGRLVQNYPTTAKCVIEADEYEICGSIRSGKCQIQPTEAYSNWVAQ